MTVEQIGKYEIEYEAVALPSDTGWAAYVAVFCESDNPAHRNNLIPRKRVAMEEQFDSEAAALEGAHRIGLTLIQ